MNTQHIGAAGELLVQYKLLKLGIDSARLTTDAGIDLVVYSPTDLLAFTVQVKTNLGPKPSGGRGPMARGWFFPHACSAQLLALVALDADKVWIFKIDEARALAQQHSERDMRQLYWRVDLPVTARGTPIRSEIEMAAYELESRATSLFLQPAADADSATWARRTALATLEDI